MILLVDFQGVTTRIHCQDNVVPSLHGPMTGTPNPTKQIDKLGLLSFTQRLGRTRTSHKLQYAVLVLSVLCHVIVQTCTARSLISF